jgi:penicillin-binding protein 1C
MRRGALLAGLLAVLLGLVLGLDRLFPPDLSRLDHLSREVLDRDGRLLRAFTTPGGSWRFGVPPEAVSPSYLAMLMAVEDKRFWRHLGVDPLALARAAGQAMRHGRIVSGGSTLTMQVARLLEPRPRTLTSKLIEIFRSLQLEARLSKGEILAIYLTLAPFGGNLEGVRAASLAWYGKEPDRLSDAEAALLVALPQAPARLAPDTAPAAARAARDRVLARAEARGVLAPAAAAAARAAAVPRRRLAMPLLAPHLAERLVAEAASGEAVRTTLDLDLQARVERLLRSALRRLPAPINVAAIVVDHAAGEVRAWAGSGDYLGAARNGMIDLARAVRSPGSTLKPFVYGLAFDELKAHPASLIRDMPTRFNDFAPGNFDGGFDGDVTVREALRRSLNLPAVTLLERVGPIAFAERLAGAGIGLRLGADAVPPGLPIVLGGVGITLEDLVTGFAAIARGGVVRRPRRLVDEPPAEPRRLLGERAAAEIAAILAEVPRPLGFAERGQDIAFKTGTSYRYRDGWAIGFDGRHTVGVWLGRADGASCTSCNGPGGAAPLLLRLFRLLPEHPLALTAERAATPPPALLRIDRAPARRAAGGPVIAFPPEGAVVELRRGALRLEVEGGERPFRWLVDGRPLPAPVWRRSTDWRPEGEGFASLTVLDARGRSAAAAVRVMLP